MEKHNTAHAIFAPEAKEAEIKDDVWQHDFGQTLQIEGLSLPPTIEVHYANKGRDTAIPQVGVTKDGITTAPIPNEILNEKGAFTAYIFVTDGKSGETCYTITGYINKRPALKAFDTPEDQEIFHAAVDAVNKAAERAESAETKATEAASQTAKDAKQTAADRAETERLVESVSGIGEQVTEVENLTKQAQTSATNAALSEQAAKTAETNAQTAQAGAETAEGNAELAERNVKASERVVEKAKQLVTQMGQEVLDNKNHVDQTVQAFDQTAQQAVANVNNAGQTQTERVQSAGNTATESVKTAQTAATQAIETAKTEAVKAVQTEGTTQTGNVTAEGAKQVQAVQQAAQEIMADREQVQENKTGIAKLKEDFYDMISQSKNLFEYPNGGKFTVVPNEDGAYVGGKNVLVVDDYTKTKNGVTVSVANGVFSVSGTALAETLISIPFEFDVIKDKLYTLSFYDAEDVQENLGTDFVYNDYGGKVFNKSLSISNKIYATKALVVSSNDNYKIKYFRFYFASGKTYQGSCKCSLIIGSHVNESFPVYDYSYAPSYEYSSVPKKITAETVFNTDRYICVSAFDNVTIKTLEKKNISYNELHDKPKINGVEIVGEKSADDFNIKVNIEKNNSVNIERKYPFGMIDLSKATIGEQTEKSTIPNGILYPVLINNTPNGEISNLFRYSCPIQVSASTFPLYTSVRMADARNGGYTVEFYVDDDFEILVYNTIYAVVVVDGVRVSNGISNVTSYAKCHTKVSFSEKKKRHICLHFGGSVKLYGIITCGVVTKYEDTRLRLISDGDSIVEGSSCIGTAYSQYGCMMATMSHILNMDFMNVGVGGSGYVKTGNQGQPNMVDRFDTYITPYNPDLLVVMAGLNDSTDNIDTVKTQVDAYWAKVKELNPKYVIMVSPYSPSTTIHSGNIAIASYLKDVAEQYKYPYIDTINGKTYDAMGNIISEYSRGAIMTEQHRQSWYSEYLDGQSGYDGTHPNKVGHEWMGGYLANEVFKICKDDFGIVR